MSIEIERKFLAVNSDYKKLSYDQKYIKQGFLNSNKNRVVRVRISEDQAFLTIKGVSSKDGTSRFEWEKEISVEEAQDLMKLCEEGIIEKKRYYHKFGNHLFEIDEFLGNNSNLVVVEVEVRHKGEEFQTPSYLGIEVTGDKKYYNAYLSKHPFKNWT